MSQQPERKHHITIAIQADDQPGTFTTTDKTAMHLEIAITADDWPHAFAALDDIAAHLAPLTNLDIRHQHVHYTARHYLNPHVDHHTYLQQLRDWLTQHQAQQELPDDPRP